MRHRFSALAFACVSLAWAAPSFAREFRVQDIPNGDKNTCLNCHGELEAETFNNFGSNARMYLDSEGAIQEAHVNWTGLCPLDSDGDGATNGEELGDPDCNWVAGQADPAGNVTNPGNGNSGANGECDNGTLDEDEECEGLELTLDDCLALGAGIGTLTCKPDCTYNYTDCSKPPPGEGSDDDGSEPVEESGCSTSSGGRAASSWAIALAVAFALGASALRRRRPHR